MTVGQLEEAMQTNEALTAAAVALLHEASPDIVRRVLRELLDSDRAPARPAAEPAHGVSNGLSASTPRVSAKTQAGTRRLSKRKHLRRQVAQPADPAWAQLRAELRAAMEYAAWTMPGSRRQPGCRRSPSDSTSVGRGHRASLAGGAGGRRDASVSPP
jgi:hypothetical protein